MIDIQAIRDRAKSPDPYANLQVLDLCDEVERLRGRWISVDEQLPPIEMPAWLKQEGRIRPIFIGCHTDTGEGLLWADCNGSEYWTGSKWRCAEAEFDDYKITHWMPLPEPPEDSDGG